MLEQDNAEASCAGPDIPSNEVAHALHEVKSHPDERQVGLDTRRSFVYYPTNLHSREKTRLQEELNEVIITVLRKRKALSYFQVRKAIRFFFERWLMQLWPIGIPRHHFRVVPHFLAIRTSAAITFRISLVITVTFQRTNKSFSAPERPNGFEIAHDGVPA